VSAIPDQLVSVRGLFGIGSDLTVPAFRERGAHVPLLDHVGRELRGNKCDEAERPFVADRNTQGGSTKPATSSSRMPIAPGGGRVTGKPCSGLIIV